LRPVGVRTWAESWALVLELEPEPWMVLAWDAVLEPM